MTIKRAVGKLTIAFATAQRAIERLKCAVIVIRLALRSATSPMRDRTTAYP